MDKVSPVGPVYQAGTLSGNPIATTAGIETLKILKSHPEYYAQIDKKATKIAETIRQWAKNRHKKLQVNQIGSLLSAFHTDIPVADYDSAISSDAASYTQYFKYMLEQGIYIAPSQYEAMFVSVAHTDDEINKTCNIILERQ